MKGIILALIFKSLTIAGDTYYVDMDNLNAGHINKPDNKYAICAYMPIDVISEKDAKEMKFYDETGHFGCRYISRYLESSDLADRFYVDYVYNNGE